MLTMNMRKAKVLQVGARWYFDQGSGISSDKDEEAAEVASRSADVLGKKEEKEIRKGTAEKETGGSVFRNY